MIDDVGDGEGRREVERRRDREGGGGRVGSRGREKEGPTSVTV